MCLQVYQIGAVDRARFGARGPGAWFVVAIVIATHERKVCSLAEWATYVWQSIRQVDSRST